MLKVKLAVIGPAKCWKTILSNFLADATESSTGDYHPTQGVRILEFESGNLNVGKKNTNVDIELWDCGGDPKFENCWRAISKDVHGIIFVFSPDKLNENYTFEKLYAYFVHQQGLQDNQCLVLCYNKAVGNIRRAALKPPLVLSNISTVTLSNLEDDGDSLRTAFAVYLRQLIQLLLDKQSREEETIAGL